MSEHGTTKEMCNSCGKSAESKARNGCHTIGCKFGDPVPSKDQLAQAWDDLSKLAEFAYEQGFHELGYNPLNVIDGALADARRENVRWENAHKILLAEIERLKQSLATANANHERFEREWYLRGDEMATAVDEIRRLRAENATLDERLARPAHERESPHCSTCGCGLAQPPGDG